MSHPRMSVIRHRLAEKECPVIVLKSNNSVASGRPTLIIQPSERTYLMIKGEQFLHSGKTFLYIPAIKRNFLYVSHQAENIFYVS
jgi:hypothetical protein